ncbi:uncharacterized protein LOC118436312 [Folsomia candida]|uniref:uncharacterized protein LOC118436312 n=1 Tax=Folsomia candida TaxID=158441 RepID=UPI00160528FD|nr:uncharacterized protein LOC118436312 [Folsomia candida]
MLYLRWVFFLVGVVAAALATVEFCSPGKSTTVFRVTPENCPFGVLFTSPVSASCLVSNDAAMSDFLVDVCRNINFNSGSEIVGQIHFMPMIDGGERYRRNVCRSRARPVQCHRSAGDHISSANTPGGV